MPEHQGLGPDDCYRLEDRWIPTIELDEDQAIAVGQLYPPVHLAPQHAQLLPERDFKSALGLGEECGLNRLRDSRDQRDHRHRRDAILSSIQCRRGFSVHTGASGSRSEA